MWYFCPPCCQSPAGLSGFSLFLYVITSLSPKNVNRPMFPKRKTLYRSTAISPYQANPSMGQSSNKTQEMFWSSLFFPCFCTLGPHLLLQAQGNKASMRACFPFFSFQVPYLSPPSSTVSCSLLSFSFLFLPRVTALVSLFTDILLVPGARKHRLVQSCLSRAPLFTSPKLFPHSDQSMGKLCAYRHDEIGIFLNICFTKIFAHQAVMTACSPPNQLNILSFGP